MSSVCSSSLSAIEAAVSGIARGKLDGAIVTGSNVCLNPRFHLEYMAAGALSKDGHSKAFDESGKLKGIWGKFFRFLCTLTSQLTTTFYC